MPILLKSLMEDQTKHLKDVQRLVPQMIAAAQEVYDSWDQNDPENDDLGGGGICQDIAEAISGILSGEGIEAVTVDNNGMGEQHVWTVIRVTEGIFEVDIPPGVYEWGGGYTWHKRPNVKFDQHSFHISKMPEGIDWDEISSG